MVAVLALRAVGEATGFKVKLPSTWAALLDVASRTVLNGTATERVHVFDRQGDRITSLDVIEAGQVLYVSASSAWRRPPDDVISGGREWRRASGRMAGASGISEVAGTMPNGGVTGRKRGVPLATIAAAAAAASSGSPSFRVSPLAAALLPPQLAATPLLLSDEQPSRLCTGRPPWGLAGDHTQLGSDANFTHLRGAARQQAFVQLCERFASRMIARARASASLPFRTGSTCAVVGSGGALAHSGSGAAIDAHDVVIRFNLAPAGGVLAAHVGESTTLRILTDKSYQPFLRSGAAAIRIAANGSTAITNRTGVGRGLRAKGQAKGLGGRAAEPRSTLLLYCMAQGWVRRSIRVRPEQGWTGLRRQRRARVRVVETPGTRAHG